MATQGPSTRQIIAHEIRELLLALPVAEHSPMHKQDDLIDEHSVLADIIVKLKGFISFLSKLNPAQYLQWMHEAFAKVVNTAESESDSPDLGLIAPEPQSDEARLSSTVSVSPKKPRKAKRKALSPTL